MECRKGAAMSVFSHSRIDSYQTCPKKYEFAYILKVPRGASGIEAFTGQRFHEAMEWLYGEVRACRLPDVEDVVARYVASWEREWTDEVAVTRAERTPEDYRAIGEKAVRDYYRRYHPFDQGVTIGLEMRIGIRLDEDHEITGFVDRLTKVCDGVWEIHDYKTSASLMTQDKADADRQLALYALAVREMYPDAEEVSLVWHYVVFDHEVRSCRSLEQLADLRVQVLDQVRHIEAQRDFPARTSALCDWCDYKPLCPEWRHQYVTAALPPDEFASETGVALVDEYMRVSDEVSRLEARKNELKDAIVQRATDEGLELLFGTEYAVKVFRYRGVCVPDSRDPRRAELEAIMRELGLWDRFSQLATVTLAKAIEAGQLDGNEMARIEEYLTRTEGAKLYPRKVT
jgi:putative RecB family exonuclease